MRSLQHMRRVLVTGSAFAGFFLGGVLLSYLLLPLTWSLPGTNPERARRCRALVARAWRLFHAYMRTSGLIHYDPGSTRLNLPAGPFVLVANHPTLVDVTALLSATPDVVSLAKSAMTRNPLVGPVLRYCGHVDAGDGSPFAGLAVAEKVVALLRANVPVLIFPEGTRSPERGLGEFRCGAFEIAARAGVPIVPLLVTCDPPTLMRGQPWYRVPDRMATMTVTQLPILRPPFNPARKVASALRALYLERLAIPSSGAPDACPPAPPVASPQAS